MRPADVCGWPASVEWYWGSVGLVDADLLRPLQIILGRRLVSRCNGLSGILAKAGGGIDAMMGFGGRSGQTCSWATGPRNPAQGDYARLL